MPLTMTPKELVKILEKNGWSEIKQEGSHKKLRKERTRRFNNSYA